MVSICLVGISVIIPFPDTLSDSFLQLLSLWRLPTLFLCTHCLPSDLLPKGLSAPQTLLPVFLVPTFFIPCPASLRSSSHPSPWSCPGSITAFCPNPPSALHLHIPPISRHYWPFCRCLGAPCPGAPSHETPRAGAAVADQGVCGPPRVPLLPACLVNQ